MKRSVSSITASKPNKINEDLLGSYESLFWLLDGATIPNELLQGHEVDTVWYVQQLCKGIEAAVKQQASFPLRDILREAIRFVRTKIMQKGVPIQSFVGKIRLLGCKEFAQKKGLCLSLSICSSLLHLRSRLCV